MVYRIDLAGLSPKSTIHDLTRRFAPCLSQGSPKTYWLELCSFSTITRFPERILMEHIDTKVSLESRLKISSIFSVRIRSKSLENLKKLSTPISQSKTGPLVARCSTTGFIRSKGEFYQMY